jgi:hypothetical protein
LSDRDLAAALGYAPDGGIVDALFGDVTIPARVNQNIARQVQRSRQAFARPQPAQGARGAIDYAAGITAGLPIIGDLFGLGRDIAQFRAEPESRTPLNMGLAALGLIPFVPPAVSYGLGRFAKSRGVEIAPAPSGPAASQAGIFAGENARTADKQALAIAKALQAAGHNDRNIYARTGWFKGGDGKWRFEIDDSQAKFIGDFEQALPTKANNYAFTGISAPMSEMLSHSPLFQAYETIPSISTKVRKRPDWMPDSVSTGAHRAGKNEQIESANKTVEGTQSTLLHELQHAVQDRENFARGGSEYSAGGFEAYRRLAGEAEARAVQARMNLTPEQRKELFPFDSYDVPIDQLVYRGQTSGQPTSVEYLDPFRDTTR